MIGRDPNTQLDIPDRLISRRHCAIASGEGRYVLRDLGSSNGTYVNGVPYGECASAGETPPSQTVVLVTALEFHCETEGKRRPDP